MILVTGASGYLGWQVVRALAGRSPARIVGTSRDGRGVAPDAEPRALRLDDGGARAERLVRDLAPEAVIHLAALANPDACARDPVAADAINRAATDALAEACARVGARLLFASTDLVFDGTRAPYAEDDPPAPLGVYMRTKAEAEAHVLQCGHLVVRIPLLYGRSAPAHPNFNSKLIDLLRAGEPVRLFSDQHRTPVEVGDAAELLCDLLASGAEGIVHLAGPERVSRHEHGLALAALLGVDPALCQPVRAADLDLTPRPRDSSLRSDRLLDLVGRAPLGISAGWRRALGG